MAATTEGCNAAGVKKGHLGIPEAVFVEFYKKKEKRTIGRSDLLQDTFEECAEVVVQKLLSYQSQGEDYHNACVHEFREQLEECEELLAQVPPLLMSSLRKMHVDQLHAGLETIRANFSERMCELDAIKEKNKDLLRPSLGHPDSRQELTDLCQQEEQRQRDLRFEIRANTRNLQDCAAESADTFVTALAALAEQLLLELDGSLNVDDVLAADPEVSKEKLFTLIRCRQSGLPLEDAAYKPVIERRGREWPGIQRIDFVGITLAEESPAQDTTSATTTKTNVSLLEAKGSQDTVVKTSMSDMTVAEKEDAQRTSSVTVAKTSSTRTPVVGLRGSQDTVVKTSMSDMSAAEKEDAQRTSSVTVAKPSSTRTTVAGVRGSQDTVAKTSMSDMTAAEKKDAQRTSSVTVVKTSSTHTPVVGVKGSQDTIAKTSTSRKTLEEAKEDQFTPSVTTAKTSLAHMSVVEARGAAYVEYRLSLDEEMTRIAAVVRSQLSEAERWEKWWQQAVLEIKQLYG